MGVKSTWDRVPRKSNGYRIDNIDDPAEETEVAYRASVARVDSGENGPDADVVGVDFHTDGNEDGEEGEGEEEVIEFDEYDM